MDANNKSFLPCRGHGRHLCVSKPRVHACLHTSHVSTGSVHTGHVSRARVQHPGGQLLITSVRHQEIRTRSQATLCITRGGPRGPSSLEISQTYIFIDTLGPCSEFWISIYLQYRVLEMSWFIDAMCTHLPLLSTAGIIHM